jgi:hypothetical protein
MNCICASLIGSPVIITWDRQILLKLKKVKIKSASRGLDVVARIVCVRMWIVPNNIKRRIQMIIVIKNVHSTRGGLETTKRRTRRIAANRGSVDAHIVPVWVEVNGRRYINRYIFSAVTLSRPFHKSGGVIDGIDLLGGAA